MQEMIKVNRLKEEKLFVCFYVGVPTAHGQINFYIINVMKIEREAYGRSEGGLDMIYIIYNMRKQIFVIRSTQHNSGSSLKIPLIVF